MRTNDILKNFPPERETTLRHIERFSMFEVFFYRSTLWHHELRVALIVDALAPQIAKTLPSCDVEKTRVMALVHDDAEIITGDVQLGHKEIMTPAELQRVEDDEASAIEKLATDFGYPASVGDYSYRTLLEEALHKNTLESQVMAYADKLDAFGESLHEILGGNLSALRTVMGYVRRLHQFGTTFPALQPLLASKDSPFTNFELRHDNLRVHAKDYIHFNRPHTRESIRRPTDLPFYNAWRSLVIQNLGEEGIVTLTTQKEFLA